MPIASKADAASCYIKDQRTQSNNRVMDWKHLQHGSYIFLQQIFGKAANKTAALKSLEFVNLQPITQQVWNPISFPQCITPGSITH